MDWEQNYWKSVLRIFFPHSNFKFAAFNVKKAQSGLNVSLIFLKQTWDCFLSTSRGFNEDKYILNWCCLFQAFLSGARKVSCMLK